MARAPRAFDSWVVVGLRVPLAALAVLAASWGAATSLGLVVAPLLGAVGVLAGELLARTKLRLVAIWGVALVVAFVGLAGWTLVTSFSWLSAAAGPGAALAVGDALLLGGLAACLCLGLRGTGARHRAGLALELGLMGAALAAPLAAHRDGAINRPFFVGDFAWAQGEDPVAYLELAGAAAAVVLALFLISERRWGRALAAAALVVLLTVAAGVVGSMVRPPPAMAENGLGLTGTGEGERGAGTKGRRATDQMDFRDNYPERGQMAPVAVALLHQDYDPPSGVYYFRQSAFSRWNGRRLVPALSAGADEDVLQIFPASVTKARWAPPESLRTRVKTTVAFLVDHVRPIALEAPESIAPARNPSPRRFRRVYDVTSLALDTSLAQLLGSEVGDESWSAETRALYTQVPTDERYASLAEQLRESLPEELRADPVARVAVVAQHLSERGTYSRRSRHASSPDPTASFLFGDLTGYCVHFAHAAAYLYRAMGVPARVATGYAYPAADRGRGSSLLIRGGDAHAWPEIFVRGVGWVVVDVTPATVAEPQLAPLDQDLQRMLGEMLRGQLDEQRRAALEVGRPRFAVAALRDAALALGRGTALAIVLLVLLAYLGKASRRLGYHVVGDAHGTRLAYKAALAFLADAGQRRSFGEPPGAFADRVAGLAPSFEVLARRAAALRLGSAAADDADGARRLARSVASELRKTVPLWRRALGLLDPVSWLRAR